MKTTVDPAGRVEIPLEIRDRTGLQPGEEVEITLDDRGVRLSPSVPGPKLVRVGNRWVARPQVPVEERPEVDIADLIRKERDRWPL